ncbi:hypothetical protein GOP47_0000926 [Adiantum capillus-veneris]|uniref:Uncharacterized protein n=1 Tax=Adiantum capillus-veneris TaxID=13818 RepID=A0A9D4ZTD9_ADICA|nr:hypothetical protein GOP47_0000926 [Adiantum capillus-veneris]
MVLAQEVSSTRFWLNFEENKAVKGRGRESRGGGEMQEAPSPDTQWVASRRKEQEGVGEQEGHLASEDIGGSSVDGMRQEGAVTKN